MQVLLDFWNSQWATYWDLNWFWQIYLTGLVIGELVALGHWVAAFMADPKVDDRADMFIVAGIATFFVLIWPFIAMMFIFGLLDDSGAFDGLASNMNRLGHWLHGHQS
jgi:hypothetical protein